MSYDICFSLIPRAYSCSLASNGVKKIIFSQIHIATLHDFQSSNPKNRVLLASPKSNIFSSTYRVRLDGEQQNNCCFQNRNSNGAIKYKFVVSEQ
jgi:hypothetical protein